MYLRCRKIRTKNFVSVHLDIIWAHIQCWDVHAKFLIKILWRSEMFFPRGESICTHVPKRISVVTKPTIMCMLLFYVSLTNLVMLACYLVQRPNRWLKPVSHFYCIPLDALLNPLPYRLLLPNRTFPRSHWYIFFPTLFICSHAQASQAQAY